MELEVGSLTDVGRKRTHNEDFLGLFRFDQNEVMALVADGMGGHASGEVASRLATETIHAVYREERGERDVLAALKSALEVANFTVLQKSLEREDLQGMGTTATALVLRGEEAFIGHVGDSRAYLLRKATLSQMTKDHSLVQRLVEQGLLKKEEANHHPQRNVITQTIGVNRDLAPELLGPIPVFPDDTFLLCTDGLVNLVSDQEILDVIRATPPQKACERLVDLANQRGGHDNITLQILKVKAPPPESRKPFLEGKRSLFFLILFLILSLLLVVNGLSLMKPELVKKFQAKIEGWWK